MTFDKYTVVATGQPKKPGWPLWRTSLGQWGVEYGVGSTPAAPGAAF
jgi:hypothetical protein